MSAVYNMHDAKTNFSKLVERATAGEDIVVAKAGKPCVRLVRIEDAPLPDRKPGGWPELAPLCDNAMTSATTDADLDAWDRKFDDL